MTMLKKLEETMSNLFRDELLRGGIVRAPAKIRALMKQTQRNLSHCRNGTGEVMGWEGLTELDLSRNHAFQKVGYFVNLGSVMKPEIQKYVLYESLYQYYRSFIILICLFTWNNTEFRNFHPAATSRKE